MREQLTKSDVKKIEEEIEYRRLVLRKELIESVKEARAQGDLSENFEYHAAKKEKNKNIIGIIVIFISIFYKYLSFYEIISETATKLLIILAVVLNVIIIAKRKFNRQQLQIIMLIFFLVLAMTYISKSIDFIVVLLISLMFYKDNLRDFFKIYFISSLTCYLFTIFLYFIGVLENNSIRRFTEDGVIVRNSLGFSHVNGVFKNFLPIVLSGYFLVKEKNIRKYNLFIFVISTILYIISNSRTGYFCIIIYLFCTSFIDIMKFRLVSGSIKYMFIICTVITLCIVAIAGKSANNPINELLSDRPIIWNMHLNEPGALRIIGGTNRLHMDNTYLTYLVNFGIFIFICVFVIKYLAIKKIKDHRILLMILILSIYGIFENGISYNIDFSLIVEFIYLFNIEKEKTKKLKEVRQKNEER